MSKVYIHGASHGAIKLSLRRSLWPSIFSLPRILPVSAKCGEEKKERIAEQIAKPNTRWDRLGASVLKLALADTKLVDAAWLAALADAGGVLPRCQDLPAEAVVTYEEMAKGGYDVAVLVISYPWVPRRL